MNRRLSVCTAVDMELFVLWRCSYCHQCYYCWCGAPIGVGGRGASVVGAAVVCVPVVVVVASGGAAIACMCWCCRD